MDGAIQRYLLVAATGLQAKLQLLRSASLLLGYGLVGMILCMAGLTRPAYAHSNYFTVHAQSFTEHLNAYSEVIPISLVRIRAREPGIIQDLHILPGQTVKAGESLGRLRGPEVRAALSNYRSAVVTDKAQLTAAQHLLKIERSERTLKLNTRKELYHAKARVAREQAQLRADRAKLESFKHTIDLRAPVTGVASAITAGDGEQVMQGQTLLSLQAPGRLWLRARFYGQEIRAIHTGMTGVFTPSDGRPPIKVKVVSILPAVASDGAQPVGLEAMQGQSVWTSGEAGTVRLEGKKITAVSIPTRALVLNRGHWWVLVHTPKGDHRQAVQTGPSRGDFTLITRGLEPGEQVVVSNAYIDFHSHFSAHYKPPD